MSKSKYAYIIILDYQTCEVLNLKYEKDKYKSVDDLMIYLEKEHLISSIDDCYYMCSNYKIKVNKKYGNN